VFCGLKTYVSLLTWSVPVFFVGHFAEKIGSKNADLELENKDNKFLQPTCWGAVPKDVYYI